MNNPFVPSQHENELALILKCHRIELNGKLMDGEQAFGKLTVLHTLFRKQYTIDWETTPVKILTQ